MTEQLLSSTATVPPTGNRFTHSLAEAAKCFTLGLRETTRPGLAFSSILITAFAAVIWTTVFIVWWHDIWAAAEQLTTLLTMGLMTLIWPAQLASNASTGMGKISAILVPIRLAASLSPIFSVVLLAAAFVLLVMLTARILLEVLLMTRIQRYCLQRYPQLKMGAKGSMRSALRDSAGALSTFVFGGLLCLIVPVFGGILLFLLASYLNVRGLVNDAMDDLATDSERRAFIKTNRLGMTLLGVMASVFMLVPLMGLFAPVTLGASVCHFGMRWLAKQPGRNS